ncbi:MAG: ABC transporter permease [Pirellulales bacterium]|nr:ABC transporter permease [Pirellulales bacterium]
MSSLHYLLSSLWHYRRVHLAVLAGVLVATAVITGALLVGDSVRGSLRDLTLQRLGRIETVLFAEQPFRAALADGLAECAEAAPLMLVTGSLTATEQDRSRHATGLSIIGALPGFWSFGEGAPPAPLSAREVALGSLLAEELDVSVGDEVLLRLPRVSSLPADSTLGEKTETTTSRRMRVAAVLPDRGLTRFSLRPSQRPPRNVFVPLPTLQELLELPQRINAVALGPAEPGALEEALRPTLDDFNIQVEQTERGILSITAQRLVLPPAIVQDVRTALPQTAIQPVITYLANTISLGERQIPYSTICGVDSLPQLGPLLEDSGKPITLDDDEIVLNDWAAEDLQAQIGDWLTVTFYEPETSHGQLQKAAPVKLRLRAIAPLVDETGQRTAAFDPGLTPSLPGVTDQQSITNWDLPFELVEPIRGKDEQYWDDYSTTPKAFVSYALAAKLWQNRWGTDSVLRISPSAKLSAPEILERVHPAPGNSGMILLPVKQQGLAASRGTTAFEGLFLGFSFFLMASAVMLIALLFRLGVEGRSAEVGVLTAVGWPMATLRRLWLGEAAAVVLMGAILGSAAGIGYARLMIYGLTTWWVAATVTPFLELYVTSASLIVGLVIGVVVALLTIAWSLRKLLALPPRQLLAGDCTDHGALAMTRTAVRRRLPAALLVTAIVLGLFALRLQGEAQAGAFFGSGALVLIALLTQLTQRLRHVSLAAPVSMSLAGLAVRNARRKPGRTILSVALTAVASFLIVALSAFRLAPTEQGTGGFDLLATADQPIHFDLDTAAGREQLGFGQRGESMLANIEIHSLRVQHGEDASCLNLYQTSQPRVIGVPKTFYERNQFAWSAFAEPTKDNPWHLLASRLGQDDQGREITPIVLDKNTATYSLHLGGVGAQWTIRDTADRRVTLQVVGLLAGSVLQGNVLMGEVNFLKLFPDTAGYRLFLIRNADDHFAKGELAEWLETQLEDYGFDATSTKEQLANFLAVQNTYLSTFQSLGAFGLLLGTLGLAVAQLRSVLERRGELALLRCTGFRRSRLAELVLGENSVLLLAGLGIGCAAALAAVLPHWLLQEADVPWRTLLLLLLVILGAGLAAGILAVRATLRAPLLPALRGD